MFVYVCHVVGNLVKEATGGSDRRAALEVCMRRQSMRSIVARVLFAQHSCMPADALTTRNSNAVMLLRVMQEGRSHIFDDSDELKQRVAAEPALSVGAQTKSFSRMWKRSGGPLVSRARDMWA